MSSEPQWTVNAIILFILDPSDIGIPGKGMVPAVGILQARIHDLILDLILASQWHSHGLTTRISLPYETVDICRHLSPPARAARNSASWRKDVSHPLILHALTWRPMLRLHGIDIQTPTLQSRSKTHDFESRTLEAPHHRQPQNPEAPT